MARAELARLEIMWTKEYLMLATNSNATVLVLEETEFLHGDPTATTYTFSLFGTVKNPLLYDADLSCPMNVLSTDLMTTMMTDAYNSALLAVNKSGKPPPWVKDLCVGEPQCTIKPSVVAVAIQEKNPCSKGSSRKLPAALAGG